MGLRLFIIIFSFWWAAIDARAQVPEEFSSVPEQWQLTLDVIKSKAQTLMVENNGLQGEYRQLIEQVQKLKRSIEGQQYKNEQSQRFLNERHGRTDQQIRIDELNQGIKIKTQQARDDEQRLEDLRRKQQRLAQNAAQPAPGDQLSDLRKQLEGETTREVLLENELGVLKNGPQTSQANALKYENLKVRKDQLESNIYAYESRLDGLRQSYLMALSGPMDKKKLAHELARVDARNNRIRDQIKSLHEDIDVLKDQVAKLERRVNFARGKDTQQ